MLKGPLWGNLTPIGATPANAPGASRGFGVSEALAGEASLGWQSAQYVGLVAGPADFAKLAGGVVQVGPLDVRLAEGRLTTSPRILLNDRVPQIVVDRGPLLDSVRISPEMCNLWLKYIAPQVADAAHAEGKLSMSLEGEVPAHRADHRGHCRDAGDSMGRSARARPDRSSSAWPASFMR